VCEKKREKVRKSRNKEKFEKVWVLEREKREGKRERK
jgi:hypothetical protein